jgi:hypothetical protein
MESDELDVEKIIKNQNFITYFESIKGKKLPKLIDEEGDPLSIITEFFEEHPEVYFNLVYTNESGWIGGHSIYGIGDIFLLNDSDCDNRWSGPFEKFENAYLNSVMCDPLKELSGDCSEDVDVFFELDSNLPNDEIIKLCRGWHCKFKINGTKYIGNGKNIKIASGQ